MKVKKAAQKNVVSKKTKPDWVVISKDIRVKKIKLYDLKLYSRPISKGLTAKQAAKVIEEYAKQSA